MQNMLKKILKTIFLMVILGVSVRTVAFAANPTPTEEGDKAKLSTAAKLKKMIAVKARESVEGAKTSLKGAKPSAIKAKVTASVEGAKKSVKDAKSLVSGEKGASPDKPAEKAPEKTAEKTPEEIQKAKPLPETPEEKAKKEAAKTPEQREAEKVAAEKEAAKTPEQREAEKVAAAKEAAKTPGQKAIDYLKDPEYLAKTPAQKIEYLMKTALQLGGESEDPGDKGYWDKKFQNWGGALAKKMSGISVPIMEKALRFNQAVKDSPAGKLERWGKDKSRSVKSDMYKMLPGGRSRREVEDERQTSEAEKKRAGLIEQYKQSGMSPEDAKEEAKKKIEEDINKATEEQLDKIAAKKISDIAAKDPKKYVKMMSNVAKKLAEGGAKEGTKKELTEGEKKYKDLLDKVTANVKLSSGEIAKLLENPTTKNLLMRDVLKEEIKDGLKTTWYENYQDASQKRRQKFASLKMQGPVIAISGLVQVAAALIGREVSKAVKNMYNTPEGEKTLEVGQAEVSYGVDKLTPEDQKNMDSLQKLAAFYSTMDVKFKNTLSKFDYEDTVFQTAEKVKYSGGEMTAGMALLFDYKGPGNIADGLTPILVRFYPMEIAGEPIDPVQVLAGVGNLNSLELIAAMRSCRPDVIFFIKAISLLNTANKKFTDLGQRQEFLSEQMNLLFARFLRTVDDDATRRANIIEKDYEKWDPVYMDNPAECFGTAPKVLRNFMSNLTVDTLDEDGKVAKLSFEEYIIDQFGEFDDVVNVEFEGDVDYDVEEQELDDKEVKLRLFAIFSRALDDVLRIEKELLEEKAPVTIKDAQEKEHTLDCKKFYMDVTKDAFSSLQNIQKKFIDATVEYASDMTDADNLKAYNSAYKAYMGALDAYTKAALEFRKKVCFYPFEKTLGYEPERVLDFVKRECKRTYQEAKHKEFFLSVLPKAFEPFAENFPFTVQDLLTYSQEAGPVKSPGRLFIAEMLPQISEKSERKKLCLKIPDVNRHQNKNLR